MFTGIITHCGTLTFRDDREGNARFVIATPPDFLEGAGPGDSIACDGVCLTAVELTPTSFAVDVSPETLRLTTLGARAIGARLNLERSLRLGDSLGGHLVLGHVDGMGAISSIEPHGESVRYVLELPAPLAPLVASKGCLAVDGISLTPTDVTATTCDLWIIPETLRRTTLGEKQGGDPVNLEVDLLSRYVARQLALR